MRITVRVVRHSLRVSAERLYALCRLLSTDERDRAARFRSIAERNRWVVCRGLLRETLGRAIGVRAGRIAFGYGPGGRPFLDPSLGFSGLSFNVSHAGDTAVIAVTTGASVGIDMEPVRPGLDFVRIARLAFSSADAAFIEGLPEGERMRVFFECWTRMEAYLKALGYGLGAPAGSTPGSWRRFDRGDGSRAVTDLPVGKGHAAALAVIADAPIEPWLELVNEEWPPPLLPFDGAPGVWASAT